MAYQGLDICAAHSYPLYYKEVLTFVDRFTALRFTATGAQPSVRRI
jgi:hypothetical protein